MYDERVAAGVRLLDQYASGPNGSNWRSIVDVNTLDLVDPWGCVLGQVFGEYSRGLNALGLYDLGLYDLDALPDTQPACDYGFTVIDPTAESWDDLTAAWRRALTTEG